MSYELNTSNRAHDVRYTQSSREALEREILKLTEWKHKAVVQLEFFQYACRLYKFCDVDQLNELLEKSNDSEA